MTKKEIVEGILKEKFASKSQQRFFYAMADKNTKKGRNFKKWAEEFSDDTDFDEIPEKVKKKNKKPKKETTNPKMKKSDLLEYIKHSSVKKKSKKSNIKEQRDQYDFSSLREMTGQDRRDIMKYFESIRQSGIINMFGASPILNWTRDDLHRFLYGERNDPESIEQQIEGEEYEDDEYEDEERSGRSISYLEKKLKLINYLLDNKQKIRDILIGAALKRINNTDGNLETRNVQRVFEKMAKEAWSFWVGIVSIN
jgi:hypothetical protein